MALTHHVMPGGRVMTGEEVVRLIREVKDDFEREKDQGLLQDSLTKAQHALAGQHACDRILRRIESREGIRLIEPGKGSRAR